MGSHSIIRFWNQPNDVLDLLNCSLSSLVSTYFVILYLSLLFLWELIQRKSDELTLISGDQGESVNNVGNKVALGSKGSSALAPQLSGVNSTATTHTDEFDSSVALLNIVCSFFSLY